MDKTLMVLGLGGVGTYAAHLAGRLPGVRVAVGDIRADHARRVANSLIADSYFLQEYRRFPDVAGFGIDMLDTEAIAEALERYRPDVIFNATRKARWWH